MNSLFDDMMRVNDEVEQTREDLKRKQSIIKAPPPKAELSVDSIAEVEESIKSPEEIPIGTKDKRNDTSVDQSRSESPEPRSISPPPKNVSGSASKLSIALDQAEAEVTPDIAPLMRKKTTVIENMDAQRKFADEQFVVNQELLSKNEEFEDRITAIEDEIRLTKEQMDAIAAAAGDEEIDQKANPLELPVNKSGETSLGGKESSLRAASRLGHIEKRLELLETGRGGKRSGPMVSSKSTDRHGSRKVLQEVYEKEQKEEVPEQEGTSERAGKLSQHADSRIDDDEQKELMKSVSGNLHNIEELVGIIDTRMKMLASKQKSMTINFSDLQVQ